MNEVKGTYVLVKFVYSEKATKFCEISTLLLTGTTYSELSNKHAANLILLEKIFLPTCLIRTYTFIYFQGKFLPTRY